MPVPGFAQGVTSQSYWMTHLGGAQTKTAAASTDATKTASAAPASNATATADAGKSSFWDDVLDVVNPLQHLPVVGTVYRAMTGDKIGDVEKVAGDTLYGGPIGLVSSLADVAFEKVTGKDFGSTVMALVGLDHSDSTTALAANTPRTDSKTTAANAAPLQLADASIATAAPTPISKLAPIAPITAPIQTVTPSVAPPAPSPPVDISSDTDALLSALARNGVTGQMQTQALDAYRRTMNMNTAPVSATIH